MDGMIPDDQVLKADAEGWAALLEKPVAAAPPGLAPALQLSGEYSADQILELEFNQKPLPFLTREDVIFEGTSMLLAAREKAGKGVPLTTPILTSGGWKTMSELVEGDQVHAPDGSLTQVVAVTDPYFDRTFRLTFSDGQEIIADARHQWVVHENQDQSRRGNQPPAVKTTEEIYGAYATFRPKTWRFKVDVPKPIRRPLAALPMDPYVLGAWLGDGATADGRISGIDVGIHDMVRVWYGPGALAVPGTRSYLGLKVDLRRTGVLGNKHVPDQYLLASEEQRLELLRGLMDTDGHVSAADPGIRWPRCEFTNTNERLADAVLFLARSLGWKASKHVGRATLNGRDCGPKYRISFVAYRDRSPFRLERKTARLNASPGKVTRASRISIVKVEQVEQVSLRCIQVDHPSGCYLVGPGLLPTHNSTLARYLCHEWVMDGRQVLYFSEEWSRVWQRQLQALGFEPGMGHFQIVEAMGKRPEDLLERARQGSEEIIVVDTCTWLFDVNLAHREAVVATLKPWVSLCALGKTVILVAHLTKKGELEGSHAFGAGVDAIITYRDAVKRGATGDLRKVEIRSRMHSDVQAPFGILKQGINFSVEDLPNEQTLTAAQEEILEILPFDVASAMSWQEVAAATGFKESKVRVILRRLVEIKLAKDTVGNLGGAGGRGHAAKYVAVLEEEEI